MATRTVVVASAASNQAKRVTIGGSVKTWGDLKAVAEVRSLIAGDVEAIVRPGNVTLGRDESELPEGDFSLFLIPTKNKAGYGVDYSGIGTAIAEAIRKAASLATDDDANTLKEDLIQVIADHFDVDPSEIGGASDDDELNDALEAAKSFTTGR